jgi:RNA recognition motif-containing protein
MPPSYAFVEYEDARDAADAYYEMQDKTIQGSPMTIQVKYYFALRL